MLAGFTKMVEAPPSLEGWPSAQLVSKADKLFAELGNSAETHLKPLWEQGVRSHQPDHGVMAALLFREGIKDPRQSCFAREAARAMAVHNLIGEVDPAVNNLFTWKSEPLGLGNK